MAEVMTTATTDMARITGPANVVYVTEKPKGQVYTVTPNPPTPRNERPSR